MKTLKKVALAAGAAVLLSATAASADVVCNDEGDCWHVKEKHEYRPEYKLQVHPEGWKWESSEEKNHRWREHEGRGYWGKGGVWIGF
jgi:opacity protein-like surface antigen